MYQLNQLMKIVICSLLSAGSAMAGTDYYREYNHMISESGMHRARFQSQHKDLCRQIFQDCKKKEKEGEQKLSLGVPIFARDGYHFVSAGMLPAETPFNITGSVQTYYKIKIDGKKYFLPKTDFDNNHISKCKVTYEYCLSGVE